ncbi:MAG: VUT family protein [Alphaproteobacteria bacterium]|nr:VUT family protein [Alphaproteobacteria bacterium SS10]
MLAKANLKRLIPSVLAMALVVLVANIAVQYPVPDALVGGALPLSDWLTWGAFVFPLAFLVTDLTNRLFGVKAAGKVVLVGFICGVVLSAIFADLRIAAASGTAFLTAQLLGVTVFDRLRQASWWMAPLISSLLGSVVDTALFFSLAFAGTGLPWVTWALGDFAAKLIMAGFALAPFRMISVWAAAKLAPTPTAA